MHEEDEQTEKNKKDQSTIVSDNPRRHARSMNEHREAKAKQSIWLICLQRTDQAGVISNHTRLCLHIPEVLKCSLGLLLHLLRALDFLVILL